MKISVIGLGYIGLPTAAVIASRGIEVVGTDTNKHVVDTVNKGEIHIVEPDLDMLVHAAVISGKLRAAINIEKSDVFIISVPTPIKDNYEPDLSYIKAAVNEVSKVLECGNLIILESTSPVGTTEKISEWISNLRQDLSTPVLGGKNITDIAIAYCPERVLPGHIIRELVENDRIIGGITEYCSSKAKNIYEIFVEGDCIETNVRTAEMCKLTENSFRDVNIAYANELSKICDELDVNTWDLISLANRHPRVNILKPGPGVGGHCISVDPWFIVNTSSESSRIIKMARIINHERPEYVFERLLATINKFGMDISKINITTMGLTYKQNVDDIRESPALQITKKISNCGFANHYIVEPNLESVSKLFENGSIIQVNLEEGIKKADVIVILVEHKEFKKINFEKLSNVVVIDVAGINV